MMTSEQRDQVWTRYAEAFGEDAGEIFTSAPNWMTDHRLAPLMASALEAGRPLTEADVTAALGPPFREWVE